MPALYTLWNTKFEKRWNVGSDDFVLPTIIAISVRLVGFVLVSGVLIYLYVAPFGCEDESLDTPPWLYGTLFATMILEFAVVIIDAIIMSKSCLGRIDHSKIPDIVRQNSDFEDGFDNPKPRWPDPDTASPRRHIKPFLLLRIFLFLLEIVLSACYGFACWSPQTTSQILECEEFRGPVYFARGVAIAWWVVILVSSTLWCVFLDPIGICTPGLLDQLDFLDEDDSDVEVNEYDMFKFHRARIGSRKIKRRLRAVLCCCVNRQERGLALEDAARVLQNIFNDVDLVGSDLLAGLILLSRHQKREKHKEDFTHGYKKLAERQLSIMSGKDESFGRDGNEYNLYSPYKDLSRDNANEEGFVLLEDMLHYCHYALGIYGWPLYIYSNLRCRTGCGVTACCKLAGKTCFGCYCRKLSRRKREKEIVADNLCFCGLASVQLLSPSAGLLDEDICHVTFENEYFKCPYVLCVDHKMKSIVLCVRGTLSIKDVLTDITVSVKQLTKDNVGEKFSAEGKCYVHRGMCRTAMDIRDKLLSTANPVLAETLHKHTNFRFVIVGHSLGAGVASILAVLLHDTFPDLICYAFSPPGCVFSHDLVKHSKNFIYSVVIGNDMVPRMSIRALQYMKNEIEILLKKCEKPKHQVIFQPRICDQLCNMCAGREMIDPSVHIKEVEDKVINRMTQQNMELPPRPSIQRPDCILSWACCAKKMPMETKPPPVKRVDKVQRVLMFVPGSILHFKIKIKAKRNCLGVCQDFKVNPEWVECGDLGVILADRGMVEDHMPTRVIEILRHYHEKVSEAKTFSQADLDRERKREWQERVYDLVNQRSPYEAPIQRDGTLRVDGKRKRKKRRMSEEGEDEIDGAMEELEEEEEEEDGEGEEGVNEEVGGGGGEKEGRGEAQEDESRDGENAREEPAEVHKLHRGRAIDKGEAEEEYITRENNMPAGVIASDGRESREEIEMTVHKFNGGYTEIDCSTL